MQAETSLRYLQYSKYCLIKEDTFILNLHLISLVCLHFPWIPTDENLGCPHVALMTRGWFACAKVAIMRRGCAIGLPQYCWASQLTCRLTCGCWDPFAACAPWKWCPKCPVSGGDRLSKDDSSTLYIFLLACKQKSKLQ